jgi:protein-tyrosine-phosphatase
MALGFFEALTGDHAVAWSEPGNEVNLAAIAAMTERGIDISNEFPTLTDETVRAADVVITMGCAMPAPSSRQTLQSGRPRRPPTPQPCAASDT